MTLMPKRLINITMTSCSEMWHYNFVIQGYVRSKAGLAFMLALIPQTLMYVSLNASPYPANSMYASLHASLYRSIFMYVIMLASLLSQSLLLLAVAGLVSTHASDQYYRCRMHGINFLVKCTANSNNSPVT